MKKIISLVLMVVMLFSISAFAEEELVLFGNVHMGDDYDEVTALFEEYGSTSTKPLLTRMHQAYKDNAIDIFRVREISIAGIDDSEVVFAFDENNKVYQAMYTFGTSSDGEDSYLTKDEADSMYLAVQTMLTNKYGIPASEYFEEQTVYVLCSFSEELGVPFTNCAEMANALKPNPITDQRCGKVSEWLVMQSDGDGILIDCFVGNNDGSYQVYILYTYIPVEAFNQEDNTNDWL